MTIRTGSFPLEYKPLQTLTICSNVLSGGGVPFEMRGVVPLLIGKGTAGPVVWLSVPKDAQGSEWLDIVVANKATFNRLDLLTASNTVSVLFQGGPLLSVIGSDDAAEVTELDLRPVGLNIHGSRNGLMVGNINMASNHFAGASTMMSLG